MFPAFPIVIEFDLWSISGFADENERPPFTFICLWYNWGVGTSTYCFVLIWPFGWLGLNINRWILYLRFMVVKRWFKNKSFANPWPEYEVVPSGYYIYWSDLFIYLFRRINRVLFKRFRRWRLRRKYNND